MTEQLYFSDLLFSPPEDFENFVPGPNAEVYCTLSNLELGRSILLWGDAGSGKTHLLKATASLYEGQYFNAQTFVQNTDLIPQAPVICIDDVHLLNEHQQAVLFNLYNTWQSYKSTAQAFSIVVSADTAPLHMSSLREDLRNRLGWDLVFHLESLDDADAQLAFVQRAFDKGLSLSKEVTPWLFTHYTRDIRTLLAMLDALDAYSLAQKRTITLPLLKDFLDSKDHSA